MPGLLFRRFQETGCDSESIMRSIEQRLSENW